MTTFKTARLATLLLTTLVLGACGKGFDTMSNLGNSSQGTDHGSTTPPTVPVGPSPFEKLEMDAYISGGVYENTKSIDLDKKNNALLVYLPFPGSFYGVYLDIPQVPGMKISTVMDSQQNSRVVLSIPLKYIVKDKIKTLPTASTLPDGRPLPGMPSGEFPSVALDIDISNKVKTYAYIGVNAVGLYLRTPYIPPVFGFQYSIKNKAQTQILGYFTIVPKAGNEDGGLFLAFRLPNEMARIIDDHLSGIIK